MKRVSYTSVEGAPLQRSKIQRALDTLGMIGIALAVAFLAALAVALYLVWYSWLSAQSAGVMIAWAMLATTAIPVCAGVALWSGYRFASVQVGKVESGMDRVLDKIAHSLYTAGIQASDVRIYGAQRLITGRESGGSQEIDLGRMPYTIEEPDPDMEVIH